MENEEKRALIEEISRFYMGGENPYTGVEKDDEELQAKEKRFWQGYKARFLNSFPKALFKYRKPNEHNFEALEKDAAWFSFPYEFDDTMDSTINNDIEAEMCQFKENPSLVIKKVATAIIQTILESKGIKVNIDESAIDDVIPMFSGDGVFDEKAAETYLIGKMPRPEAEAELEIIKKVTDSKSVRKIENDINRLLAFYCSMNKKIRSQMFTYCLAEESDNQAMWGLCADESKGFCIEYKFLEEDCLAQRMLLNLLPIYYGDKPSISFFDVLARSICVANGVKGIDINDYSSWLVSSVTKNTSYQFQKEWRITFDASIAFDPQKEKYKHLQEFPFATSIIMGERISEEHAKKLTEIAKKKGLSLFQRKLNYTGSKIVVERVL